MKMTIEWSNQMSPPGTGNWLENSLTYFLSCNKSLFCRSACKASLKSFNLVPFAVLLIAFVISVALSINFIICKKSPYLQPRVVMAGLPILIPEGMRALLSPGTVFLLIAIEISFMTASILPPSTPLLRMSVTKRWLSVPPETMVNPRESK